MPAVFHDGQVGVVLLGKRSDRIKGGQLITAAVQDRGRTIPADRVTSDIAEMIPRQILAEVGVNNTSPLQFVLGDIRPRHHVSDQLFHVDDRIAVAGQLID